MSKIEAGEGPIFYLPVSSVRRTLPVITPYIGAILWWEDVRR